MECIPTEFWGTVGFAIVILAVGLMYKIIS